RFVEKGKELTENLLAYAGLGNYQVEAINPNEIISKISEQLRKDNQEIHVHGKYQNGIWHIEVNEGQFEKNNIEPCIQRRRGHARGWGASH
ncbi:hypothetical protein ACFL7M_17960, partial [Thermodesulfobacteriota bacterium]